MTKTKNLTKKEIEKIEFRNNQLEYANKLQHLTPIHRKWIKNPELTIERDESFGSFMTYNGEPVNSFEKFLDEHKELDDKYNLVQYVLKRMNVKIDFETKELTAIEEETTNLAEAVNA